MLEELRLARRGEHASNLGAVLAHLFAKAAGVNAYVVDLKNVYGSGWVCPRHDPRAQETRAPTPIALTVQRWIIALFTPDLLLMTL
jgi:butyrate kinase